MVWPFNKPAPVVVEEKSLGDPTAELLELFGAIPASSVAVSHAEALTVPAVQAAVRLISEAAACLDIKVQRRVGTEFEDAPNHPAWKILRDRANDWTSGYELIRNLLAQALTDNKGGLAFVTRVGGSPREVIQYASSVWQVDYDTVTGEPTYRLNNAIVNRDNVVHVRGAFAKCPLSLAAEAIGTAKALERYLAGLFKNGARPGGVIEHPGKLGDTGAKAMLAGWKAAYGGQSTAGKTALLWEGASFKPMAMTSTDAQFIENRKYQTLEISRAFRVPPSMLYDLDRATWSNASQMGREFLVYSLEPWLKALEAALRRALFTREEQDDYVVVFDRDDLTRADLGERATAYASLVTSRIYSPNELRAWDGAPPYVGGESHLNPAIDTATPANDNTPPTEAADAANQV